MSEALESPKKKTGIRVGLSVDHIRSFVSVGYRNEEKSQATIAHKTAEKRLGNRIALSTRFSTAGVSQNDSQNEPLKGLQIVGNTDLTRSYLRVSLPPAQRGLQIARGPRRSRMGSKRIAVRSPRTP